MVIIYSLGLLQIAVNEDFHVKKNISYAFYYFNGEFTGNGY